MRISDWSSDVCSSDLARIARSAGIAEDQYVLQFRAYGRDGVMGLHEPLRDAPIHELGLIIDLVGRTQERSEERRVGQEWVWTCLSRWTPTNSKTKPINRYDNTDMRWNKSEIIS